MSVAYASNRPSVAAVGAGGVIRTVGEGVATITATVTSGGVSKSTSFVVDVVAQLSGITVNGAPLTSLSPARPFAADWYAYDVVVPDGAAVPVVAATSADPQAVVSVAQAATVPGTATVTSTGADGTAYTYTLNFARAAKSDEFNDAALSPVWRCVRPDAAKLGESGGRADHRGRAGRPQHGHQHRAQPRAPAGARRLGAGDEGRRAAAGQPAGWAHRLPGRQRLPQARRRVQRRRDQRPGARDDGGLLGHADRAGHGATGARPAADGREDRHQPIRLRSRPTSRCG